MKELAQCLRTPSPFRWYSKFLISRHTMMGCEFRTAGKYVNSFLIGSKLSQLTIFLWFAVIIGCPRLLVDDWDVDVGWSMRSTTVSSTSRSNSARISASFCWPVVFAASSNCFMRAREDLEARENRRIIKEINAGMRTGNMIYINYFHNIIQSLKNMKEVADRSRGSMGNLTEGMGVRTILDVIFWTRQ